MVPDLLRDDLPHILVNLDRDAVVFDRAALTLPGQVSAPLEGVLKSENVIACVLEGLDAGLACRGFLTFCHGWPEAKLLYPARSTHLALAQTTIGHLFPNSRNGRAWRKGRKTRRGTTAPVAVPRFLQAS